MNQPGCPLDHIFYAGFWGLLLNNRHLGGSNFIHHTLSTKLSEISHLGALAQGNLYLRVAVVLRFLKTLSGTHKMLTALDSTILGAVIFRRGDHWTLLTQISDELLLLSNITKVNGLIILFSSLAARILTDGIVTRILDLATVGP